MNKTGIEWCTMTWNTLRGCHHVSPGCYNCYAEEVARRFAKPGLPFNGVIDTNTGNWSGDIQFVPSKIDEPLKKRAPQIIFANSMSDILHPAVKPRWIKEILEMVTGCPRHFFMFLTKRPGYLKRKFTPTWIELCEFARTKINNLAVGVSIESQDFVWRAEKLLSDWPGRCFLSIEPLLGPVSIRRVLEGDHGHRIEQVIVGGETGDGARPIYADWVRNLRDETKDADRSFFFKHWGTGAYTKKALAMLGRCIDDTEWNESPWDVPLPLYVEQQAEFARALAARKLIDPMA